MLWTWALSRRSCNAYSVGSTLCIAVITDSARALFLSFYAMCFKMYRVVVLLIVTIAVSVVRSFLVALLLVHSEYRNHVRRTGNQPAPPFIQRRQEKGFETRKIHSYVLCLWVMIIRRKKTHTKKAVFICSAKCAIRWNRDESHVMAEWQERGATTVKSGWKKTDRKYKCFSWLFALFFQSNNHTLMFHTIIVFA